MVAQSSALSGLHHLPAEILSSIAYHADNASVNRLRQTCRTIYKALVYKFSARYSWRLRNLKFMVTRDSLTVLLSLSEVPEYRARMKTLSISTYRLRSDYMTSVPKLQLPKKQRNIMDKLLEQQKGFEESGQALLMLSTIFLNLRTVESLKGIWLGSRLSDYPPSRTMVHQEETTYGLKRLASRLRLPPRKLHYHHFGYLVADTRPPPEMFKLPFYALAASGFDRKIVIVTIRAPLEGWGLPQGGNERVYTAWKSVSQTCIEGLWIADRHHKRSNAMGHVPNCERQTEWFRDLLQAPAGAKRLVLNGCSRPRCTHCLFLGATIDLAPHSNLCHVTFNTIEIRQATFVEFFNRFKDTLQVVQFNKAACSWGDSWKDVFVALQGASALRCLEIDSLW